MVAEQLLVQLLIVAIVITVSILLFNFITGKFLDVTIEKTNLQEYSKAMNMLHVLGNSIQLAKLDDNSNPIKLVFDSTKLTLFNNKGEELDCCSYADFDYWAEIEDLNTKTKWTIGFPENYINDNFLRGKNCKAIDSDKPFARYSIPATVMIPISGLYYCKGEAFECNKFNLDPNGCRRQDGCTPSQADICTGAPVPCNQITDGANCIEQKGCSWNFKSFVEYINPASIRMKLVKTPLSNIAFNVLRACQSIQYDIPYEITFPVYNIKDIEVRSGSIDTICVTLNPAKFGIDRACKEIVCDLDIEKTGQVNEFICDQITVKREGNKVKIIG